ncbi:MAG: nucleotidyltransferase family protein [Rectinemataceae bacterium]
MKQEFELLVRACGLARGLPVRGPAQQSQLPDGFDQANFVRMAVQHKVASTAYAGLKKLGLRLDAPWAARLKQEAAQTAMLRDQIVKEATDVDQLLWSRGIPSLVLKGPALSAQLYGDPCIREYTDLDIIVNTNDIESIVGILGEAGYLPDEQYINGSNYRKKRSCMIKVGHHVDLWKRGLKFRVELHDRNGWDEEVFRHDRLDTVFQNVEWITGKGYGFHAPCLSDHGVLMLAHGSRHAWCLLIWVLDAASFMHSSSDQDLIELMQKINTLGLANLFAVMNEVINTAYPIERNLVLFFAPVSRRIQRASSFAFTRLEAGGNNMFTLRDAPDLFFSYILQMSGNFADIGRALRKVMRITPEEAKHFPLPRALHFVYLFLLPFFIIRRLKITRKVSNAR